MQHRFQQKRILVKLTFFMSKIRQNYSRPLTVPESKNKASVTFHVFFTNFAYDRNYGQRLLHKREILQYFRN